MTTKVKIQNKTTLRFKIPIIVKFDSVNYHSYSPALKGLHMDGETEKEALDNARDTARNFLEIMIKSNIPIPLSILTREEAEKLPTSQQTEGYFEEEIVVNLK